MANHEKRTEVTLTDYMRENLNKVALQEGFKSYELKVDQGMSVGDGFIGLMYKAFIPETDSDNSLFHN